MRRSRIQILLLASYIVFVSWLHSLVLKVQLPWLPIHLNLMKLLNRSTCWVFVCSTNDIYTCLYTGMWCHKDLLLWIWLILLWPSIHFAPGPTVYARTQNSDTLYLYIFSPNPLLCGMELMFLPVVRSRYTKCWRCLLQRSSRTELFI